MAAQYKLFTASLEPTQIEALKALSRRSGMSASALARYAIARFLREPAIFLPSADSVANNHDKRDYVGATQSTHGKEEADGSDSHGPAAVTAG